jgi:hypothetical protein
MRNRRLCGTAAARPDRAKLVERKNGIWHAGKMQKMIKHVYVTVAQ